ncbi:hypothetical protein KJ359_001967 [Pestalotiopsis sp. 9143b]|nr:hypothetical protein KJ359_001967 [Pestalotiopsis sp. 9143b]
MLSESPEPTPSYDDVESLILHIQEDTNFSDETLRVQHVALKIQDGWALPEWAKLKDDPFHKGHILADLQFQHLDDNVDWDKIDEAVQRMIEIEASRNGGDGGDGGDDAKENIGGQ